MARKHAYQRALGAAGTSAACAECKLATASTADSVSHVGAKRPALCPLGMSPGGLATRTGIT